MPALALKLGDLKCFECLLIFSSTQDCGLQAFSAPLDLPTLVVLAFSGQGRCAFTLATHQPDSENVLTQVNVSRPYAWGRMGQAPAPGSTVVWDRSANKTVSCTPEVCPYATPVSGTNGTGGTQYVNRAPVLSGNSNVVLDVRNSKLTSVALQVGSVGYGHAYFQHHLRTQ